MGRSLETAAARWLAVAMLVLGTGCVEYHESLVIERDGSGTASLRLGIDETFIRLAEVTGDEPAADALRAAFDGRPGVTVRAFRRHAAGGLRWQEIDLEFESLARLEAAANQPGQAFRLAEDGAGHLVYERTLDLARQRYEGVVRDMADSVLRTLLERYRWTFEVRFPSAIVEADPPAERIDATTVRWEFALAGSIGRPLTMRAVVREPSRPLIGLLAGVSAMLVLTALTALVLRRRRSRPTPPAGPAAGGPAP